MVNVVCVGVGVGVGVVRCFRCWFVVVLLLSLMLL